MSAEFDKNLFSDDHRVSNAPTMVDSSSDLNYEPMKTGATDDEEVPPHVKVEDRHESAATRSAKLKKATALDADVEAKGGLEPADWKPQKAEWFIMLSLSTLSLMAVLPVSSPSLSF